MKASQFVNDYKRTFKGHDLIMNEVNAVENVKQIMDEFDVL
jgi:hypothetical protein